MAFQSYIFPIPMFLDSCDPKKPSEFQKSNIAGLDILKLQDRISHLLTFQNMYSLACNHNEPNRKTNSYT